MWRQFVEPKFSEKVLRLPELHRVATLGMVSDARFLIKYGADMDQLSEDRSTALHYACQAGHEAMVRLLLDHGADPKLFNGDGDSCLHLAARAGSVQILKQLVEKKLPLDVENQSKLTPLHVAAQADQGAAIDFLISAGARVNARTCNTGHSSLDLAAASGRVDAMRRLLDSGAFLGKALHLAAREGHTDAVAVLLNIGADVNAVDENGDAPIHLAVIGGHGDILYLLYDGGADLEKAGCNGDKAVDLAVGYPHLLQWLLDHQGQDRSELRNRSNQEDPAESLHQVRNITNSTGRYLSDQYSEDRVSSWLQSF